MTETSDPQTRDSAFSDGPPADRRQRIERARERLGAIYRPACLLCEVRCGVDREADRRGACGLAKHTPVYRRLVHFGEERPLVPSYAVWLAGCNFSCTFCSDEHALRPPLPGRVFSPDELADAIAADLRESRFRVRNINFVGGEPALSLPYLAEVALALLDRMAEVPPLLLNTNGYLTESALLAALDVFEIFIVDLKFGSDSCARQIAGQRDYVRILDRNLSAIARSGRSLWVRHLLMPDHLDCCTEPVLRRLESLPEARVNAMPAFVAFGDGWRSLRRDEIARARARFEASRIARRYWDGEALKP